MKTLYLLPYSIQEVAYSFNPENLTNIINNFSTLPLKEILSVEIEDELAVQLESFSDLKSTPSNRIVDEQYYQKQEKFLDNPPAWHNEDGMRIYVFFDANKECFWSPSGNNLNSYYERNPERYLSRAIRVELTRESYIRLYGYFDSWTDNF